MESFSVQRLDHGIPVLRSVSNLCACRPYRCVMETSEFWQRGFSKLRDLLAGCRKRPLFADCGHGLVHFWHPFLSTNWYPFLGTGFGTHFWVRMSWVGTKVKKAVRFGAPKQVPKTGTIPVSKMRTQIGARLEPELLA